MNKRDGVFWNVLPPRGRPEAILRPRAGEQAFEVERVAPSAALAEFVDYFWLVRWRVDQPHHQQVVPQPRVHVAAEHGRLLVHGVSRAPFFRTLTGTGHVLGAAFHAGGFRPLLGASLRSIAGAVRPAGEVLGVEDRPAAEAVLADTTDTGEVVRIFERYLLGVIPEPDPVGREVTALVGEVGRDPALVRVEQLAAHAGLSSRSLQRLFVEYLGVGPKWVIQRSRILDATTAAHSGRPIDWAELAHRLGFSDQAHLTRVFTAAVGNPPARYQRDPGTS